MNMEMHLPIRSKNTSHANGMFERDMENHIGDFSKQFLIR
jgi:hypothetical protein